MKRTDSLWAAGVVFCASCVVACTPFEHATLDGAAGDGSAGKLGADATDAVDAADAHDLLADVENAVDGPNTQDLITDVEPSESNTREVAGDVGEVGADAPGSPPDALPGDAADHPGGLPQGATCASDQACASSHCVEGSCCDKACTTGCYSCRSANTTAADGTCAPVKVGVAHGGDCAMSPVSLCGNDGTCDGKGACRKWPSGTQCKAAVCAGGTSTFTPASACDGQGACVTPAAFTCGLYTCKAATNTCNANCSGAAECASGTYCAGTSCTPKKSPGALCGSANECASASCGGRCCSTGTTCTCPQPSADNLIKNAGFDADLAGWTIDAGAGTATWDATDATDCPFSGSLHLFVPMGSGSAKRVSQCVNLDVASTYQFAARIRLIVSGGEVDCGLDTFPQTGCTGVGVPDYTVQWINTSWASSDIAIAVPAGSASARITCFAVSNANSDVDGLVDMVYVSRAPALF